MVFSDAKRTVFLLGLILAFVALSGADCDNTPPALEPIGDLSIIAGAPFSLQLVGADADGDSLTYYVDGPDIPSDATFDPATGLFEWNPTFWDLYTLELTFGVSDGEDVAEETITLHVAADTDFVEIYLDPEDATIGVGDELWVTAYGVRANGDVAEDIYVNYVNGDESVAFMEYDGILTGVAPGQTTISAWLITPETLADELPVTVE